MTEYMHIKIWPVTFVLKSLHWLPIQQRICFKLGLIVYKMLNSGQPQYWNQFPFPRLVIVHIGHLIVFLWLCQRPKLFLADELFLVLDLNSGTLFLHLFCSASCHFRFIIWLTFFSWLIPPWTTFLWMNWLSVSWPYYYPKTYLFQLIHPPWTTFLSMKWLSDWQPDYIPKTYLKFSVDSFHHGVLFCQWIDFLIGDLITAWLVCTIVWCLVHCWILR